jgi:hypothetical protein
VVGVTNQHCIHRVWQARIVLGRDYYVDVARTWPVLPTAGDSLSAK